MIFKNNGDRMTPPAPKIGNIAKSFLYQHQVDGWIGKQGMVRYTGPRCGCLQLTRMQEAIYGGVQLAVISKCCNRAIVISVRGVSL